MGTKKYLALSIGPIFGLINQSKTVRELWVSSFMFSEFTRYFIEGTLDKAKCLSPVKSVEPTTWGAGIYPDRVFWELEDGFDERNVIDFQEKVLEKMVTHSSDTISLNEFKSALHFYWVMGEWSDEKLEEKNFIFRLNDLLDTAELTQKWEHTDQKDIITKLIAKGKFPDNILNRPIYKWRDRRLDEKLIPYKIDGKNKIGRYPSIEELTTTPLYRFFQKKYDDIYSENSEILKNDDEKKNQPDKDISAMSKFKKIAGEKFLNRHKYICIVNSDGDGIGDILKNLDYAKDNSELVLFSKSLNEFSINASEMVFEYGGIPIYSGGDDLLFLAPVTGKDDKKNIFDLLHDLNTIFSNDTFKDEIFKNKEVSLSFGLSITYYKHPLNEALQSAQHLMKDVAKKHEEKINGNVKEKNAIAFKIQKHSGQYFETTLCIDSEFYRLFMELLNEYKTDDSRYLTSLMFKMNELKTILALIGRDEGKLKTFFKNNFNEKVHEENKKLTEKIQELIVEQFSQNRVDFDSPKKGNCDLSYADIDPQDTQLKTNIERIFACLKFIHFLRCKDKDDDNI
ncbi:MAG: type III-B CRISPR-associated protein Cas10/Cmr2 [Chitinophagales bacterium]|nr:type III-B CRISPR-associated protein Cas10/Cmr2 [Chitinophagales bacterium]